MIYYKFCDYCGTKFIVEYYNNYDNTDKPEPGDYHVCLEHTYLNKIKEVK